MRYLIAAFQFLLIFCVVGFFVFIGTLLLYAVCTGLEEESVGVGWWIAIIAPVLLLGTLAGIRAALKNLGKPLPENPMDIGGVAANGPRVAVSAGSCIPLIRVVVVGLPLAILVWHGFLRGQVAAGLGVYIAIMLMGPVFLLAVIWLFLPLRVIVKQGVFSIGGPSRLFCPASNVETFVLESRPPLPSKLIDRLTEKSRARLRNLAVLRVCFRSLEKVTPANQRKGLEESFAQKGAHIEIVDVFTLDQVNSIRRVLGMESQEIDLPPNRAEKEQG